MSLTHSNPVSANGDGKRQPGDSSPLPPPVGQDPGASTTDDTPFSADPPPVNLRPSEGPRPARTPAEPASPTGAKASTDPDAPTDPVVPPPPPAAEPSEPKRSVGGRWHATREWLYPCLRIVLVIVVVASLFVNGLRLLSFMMLAVAAIAAVVGAFRRSRRNTAKAELCHVRFNERKRIVGSFNTNGGSGKTTIICLMATLWAEISRKAICLADLNNNTGHAGERLGIREKTTIRVSNVYNKLRNPNELRRLVDELPTTKHRLHVIDREEEVIEKDRLRRPQVREVIGVLYRVFHSVFFDNGNDVIGEYEMAAADVVDVALLVANTGKPESLLDVARTISNFERNGIENLAARTIVVLCRPYPWPFKRWNTIPDLNPDTQVFYLPWDLHIKLVKFGRPLDFDKLRSRTKEALYDIALAVCDLAPPETGRLSPDDDTETWIDTVLADTPSKALVVYKSGDAPEEPAEVSELASGSDKPAVDPNPSDAEPPADVEPTTLPS
jgi:MinD-like ATPase involved in chromosome partitioning or flagellar assembly